MNRGGFKIVGAPLVGALSLELRMGGNDRAGTRPNRRAGTRPNRRAGTRPAPTSLGDVAGIFKSISIVVRSIISVLFPPHKGPHKFGLFVTDSAVEVVNDRI